MWGGEGLKEIKMFASHPYLFIFLQLSWFPPNILRVGEKNNPELGNLRPITWRILAGWKVCAPEENSERIPDLIFHAFSLIEFHDQRHFKNWFSSLCSVCIFSPKSASKVQCTKHPILIT